MKNMKFLALTFVTSVLLLSSCTKTTNTTTNEKVAPNLSSLANVNNKNYTERACITGTCAGTKCELAQGSCKKARDCEAIPGGCVDLVQEILDNVDVWSAQHANNMVAGDYIEDDQDCWDLSYNLAHTILMERAASLGE
ncbi:MAG: hypothetical protein H6550_00795 [Chitinophagales bacterium]|nr:hypothetical protein [Chitinophagales bacterium]